MLFICLYRSTSQTHDQLEDFLKSLDLLLSDINDAFTGDFNPTSLKGWNRDKDYLERLEIDSIAPAAGYNQIIK